ncbi:hypothetical protein J2W48_004559 [Flavobacterium piscis]|uniref:Uncharacterized protein n=1 Tax=Flavobacterium piscis TaxID=1114874 RepID=A0ABU1YED1_9FLAO|nr:hypothetical protein [Flavobacterium piscis]
MKNNLILSKVTVKLSSQIILLLQIGLVLDVNEKEEDSSQGS